MKKLWFALFQDYEGRWQAITGDHGEVFMWKTKAKAEKALKRHWAKNILHYCHVEVQHVR